MVGIDRFGNLKCRVLPLFLLISRLFFTHALAIPNRVSIVTGANGYVGREIVQVLLQQQQEEASKCVYCLVRESRVDSEKEYWDNNEWAKNGNQNVKVLAYDMTDGGKSLKIALEEAAASEDDTEICIYHVASVFGPTENHVQTAKDNVKGTEDLVKAASTYPNCKLVFTSSTAAVRGSGQTPLNGEFYTHEDWNTYSKLGDNWGSSYQWSKAESERRAWELSKELNVPMSSICPSFVFGPPTDFKRLSSSYAIKLVRQWVLGESEVQSRLCVDVRDVAKAHVAASKRMGQRFIVSTESRIPSKDMAEALKEVCAKSGLGDMDKITYDAQFQGGAIPIGAKEVEATDELQQKLGITLRPVQETIADMGLALLKANAEVI